MQRQPGFVVAGMAWLLAGAGLLLGSWLLGRQPDPLLAVLLSQAAVALPVLVLLVVLRPRELGLGPASPRNLLLGAGVGCLAIVSSFAINGLTILIAGMPPKDLGVQQVIDQLTERYGLANLLLLTAVLAGLVEEALFRGVILTGLRKHLSPAAAVLICALLFAVLHLSPWRFLPQLALGCLLGWLTLRTGSCWPAAVAHAAHNGGVLLIAGWAKAHS